MTTNFIDDLCCQEDGLQGRSWHCQGPKTGLPSFGATSGGTLAFFDFTADTSFAYLYLNLTLKVENSLNVFFSTVLFLEGKCFILSVPL